MQLKSILPFAAAAAAAVMPSLSRTSTSSLGPFLDNIHPRGEQSCYKEPDVWDVKDVRWGFSQTDKKRTDWSFRFLDKTNDVDTHCVVNLGHTDPVGKGTSLDATDIYPCHNDKIRFQLHTPNGDPCTYISIWEKLCDEGL